LFATHNLVPPTLLPIAAAVNIGVESYLGTVILIGLIVSIPAVIAGYIWAVRVGTKIKVENEEDEEFTYDYDTILKEFGEMPSTFKSFDHIFVRINLIGLGLVIPFSDRSGTFLDVFLFLVSSVVALLVGVFFAFLLLPEYNEKTLTEWIGVGIKEAAPILLITGAGGAFGSVIQETAITDLVEGLGQNAFFTGVF